MSNPQQAFRYEHVTYSGGVDEYENPLPGPTKIELRVYSIKKFTPKGYVVETWGRDRFVRADALKKYAHLTKEEALDAYIARRKSEIRILTARLDRNKDMLVHAERVKGAGSFADDRFVL